MKSQYDHHVAIDCARCGKTVEFDCASSDLAAWRAGKLIQEALPYLTAGEREILISGFCGDCFDEMFGVENDEQ